MLLFATFRYSLNVARGLKECSVLEKELDLFNSKRLGKFRLPVVKSISHLLELLNIPDREDFFFFSNNRRRLYNKSFIPKKSGGKRMIEAPIPDLKNIQKAIDDVFFRHFELSKHCCAYRKNISIVDNALPHLGAKTLLKFDIKDFFPSITLKNVYYQFRYYGYGKNVAKYLGFLCVNGDCVLPQGAPTSPMLSNLVCVRLDARISGYCKSTNSKYCLKYTRYADDITISSNRRLAKEEINSIKKMINAIIISEGFYPNYDKFKCFHVGQKMMVTGININSKNELHVDKLKLREVEIAIHCIKKFGLLSHIEYLNRKKEYSWTESTYEKHIFGMAFYIKMIDCELGVKLIAELKRLFK